MLEYKVTSDSARQRLDKFLRRRLANVPLSHLYKMVRTKKVRVNGARAEIGQLLAEGDLVSVRGPQAALLGPSQVEPRQVREKPASEVGQDFGVLYEDDAILVCDKPAGLAIHPGSGLTGETLVDQARAYLARQGLEVAEGEFRPSPAHRLDRETSGAVVVAKTRQAMVRLTEVFTAGGADKTYLALAKGRFQKDRGTIALRLAEHQQTANSKSQRGVNMQEAVTHWFRLAGSAQATLLELRIETGRTHQIRRHLAAIGHPVAGDGKYGDFPFNREARAQFGLRRMFLHASRLALPHPISGKRLAFSSPLPKELAEALGRARIDWKDGARSAS